MICVSIADVTAETAAALAAGYPFVEFRLDRLPVSLKESTELFSIAKQCIATCRPVPGMEDRRILMLENALRNGADFVDIEIDAEDELLKKMEKNIRQSASKLIVSYHNYEETPEMSGLMKIYETARKRHADLVKIACMVRNPQDNCTLLSLCSECQNLIVIGMGEAGRISRILAPLSGSPFTFAYPDAQSNTAPGQLPYSKMRDIIDNLKELLHEN
ncbi:MAG: type I 3-dehydroquinate dehydratase [Acidobacteria bacterium]|nr:type I 3-dehydroquinate dehydratase [Acidobacteriota bacterium]